jgi:hypothetical protein
VDFVEASSHRLDDQSCPRECVCKRIETRKHST